MNRKKWKAGDKTHTLWMVKLAEEVGECAQIVADLVERHDEGTCDDDYAAKQRDKLIKELNHAEFIARQFRRQLLRERDDDGSRASKCPPGTPLKGAAHDGA